MAYETRRAKRSRGGRFGEVILCRKSMLVPGDAPRLLLLSGRAGCALFVDLMGRPTPCGRLSCRLPRYATARMRVDITRRLARNIAQARAEVFCGGREGKV